MTDHPDGGEALPVYEGITQPTRYRVVVRGRLGDGLGVAFDQLERDVRDGETSLTGTFADQAQLFGLLDRLQDLGVPIVSVNPVG